jgi:hypothetical protein
MMSNQDLKLKMYELQKEITYLHNLLKYNKNLDESIGD